MKPVWIKYYGLIPMTKRGYLVTLTVAGLFALFALLFAALLVGLPPIKTLWERDQAMAQRGLTGLFYNYFWWFLIVCLCAQVIDTMCTMRAFAKKEVEQRALLDELEGDQSPPSDADETNMQRYRR